MLERLDNQACFLIQQPAYENPALIPITMMKQWKDEKVERTAARASVHTENSAMTVQLVKTSTLKVLYELPHVHLEQSKQVVLK